MIQFDSKGTPLYPFLQDLRAINSFVIPQQAVAATTILTFISAEAAWFTVLDPCSTFFSTPLHPNSQLLFTFTFKGDN